MDEQTEIKKKPRGKPFQKGNIRGKIIPEKQILSDTEALVVYPDKNIMSLRPIINEIIPSLKEEVTQKNLDEKKDLELIDSLKFKEGENTLTIRFSKKHNRMFRIQIFLNDEIEIRPVTYTGASTGYSFWNMLKGSLKK